MKHPSPRRAASGAVLALALMAPWACLRWPRLHPVPTDRPAARRGARPAPSSSRLSNGMTLIVQPDRRAPTAVQMLWVRVGSVDEVDGTSGVAHVLEHMMFKGTKHIKPGEFSRRVAALGGRRTPSPPATTPATTSRFRSASWNRS